MLKIYTDISYYQKSYRNFLCDILRPFLPKNRFSEFGIDDNIIKLVEQIEDSDICLLPMAWNYYLNTNQVDKAETFIQRAKKGNKKILIWVMGDYFLSLPNDDGIIGLHYGAYKSKSTENTFPLPVIISDPLSLLQCDSINIRELNKVPTIGFCGQTDPNLIISSIKMARLSWQNIKYYMQISKYYPGPIMPSTYLRKTVLDILDNCKSVQTNFIRRKRYQGGKSKKEGSYKKLRLDFFNNIQNTDYTVCIRGGGNFSARFYETLAVGRIPIFINTDCMLPFSNEINWDKHVIWIEKNEITDIEKKVIEFHNSFTPEKFAELQINNRKLWEKYFYFPNYYKRLVMLIESYYK